ncbi:MAG: cation:proton antiporter [Actinomycetes bacterium]
MTEQLQALFAVTLIAALAPVVVALLPGRIPQVVVFLVGGVIIGPQVLNIASPDQLQLLATVGLGMLFLLAGYELPPLLLRQRPGQLALVGWGVSVAVAISVVGVLAATGFVRAFVPVALALTTTALGTLLPILRDNNMLVGAFGEDIFAAGAVGELGPVLAISLFLGINGSWESALAIASVTALAFLLAKVTRVLSDSKVGSVVHATQDATSQSALRWTITLLVCLLLVTETFGLDAVLGAFLAGMALRRSSAMPEEQHQRLLLKLDAVGYGFFIPVFFVVSGMGLDIASIAQNPLRLVVFFVLLLAVRGVPSLLVYRSALPMRERVELMFLTATALPLLVALAHIGLENGTMLPENAAALVGAGALSVAVFPTVATRLHRKDPVDEGAPVRNSP